MLNLNRKMRTVYVPTTLVGRLFQPKRVPAPPTLLTHDDAPVAFNRPPLDTH